MFPVRLQLPRGMVRNALNARAIFIVPITNIAKTMFACCLRDAVKRHRIANHPTTVAQVIPAYRFVRRGHVREKRRNAT